MGDCIAAFFVACRSFMVPWHAGRTFRGVLGSWLHAHAVVLCDSQQHDARRMGHWRMLRITTSGCQAKSKGTFDKVTCIYWRCCTWVPTF